MTAPRTRSTLLGDAEYFAMELARRLEGLQGIEPTGHVRTNWQQAAGLTRRVRGYLRHQRDLDRRRRRLEAIKGRRLPSHNPRAADAAGK
jgi:hypothetical protein